MKGAAACHEGAGAAIARGVSVKGHTASDNLEEATEEETQFWNRRPKRRNNFGTGDPRGKNNVGTGDARGMCLLFFASWLARSMFSLVAASFAGGNVM